MPLGKRLKLRRAAAGLTQRESADLLGVSLSTFRFYEYDRIEMPVQRFDRYYDLTDKFCQIERQAREERKRLKRSIS